ncbi:MAG: UDP-galactopyranose mutase [Terrimicrobiaceae bacterium]
MLDYDYLIVGAGFAGLVSAERLCNELGARCLVVDKRTHIGGNAADEYDDHGVLLHTYGPHYFRTNSEKVREYLSRFTEWHPVEYKILAHTHGRYWNFPVNLNTFEQFLGRPSNTEEMEAWIEKHRIPTDNPANSEEVILSQIGPEFYELFFKGYTMKQWKRHPRELDASVCGRIPIRTNRDDRYLREEFQALPRAGYSAMFRRIVASCGERLTLMLNEDYRVVLPHIRYKHLIFTGPIDEFFDYCHGRLPYRSLRFERKSFTAEQLATLQPSHPATSSHNEARRANSDQPSTFFPPPGFYQPAMQVNFPNDHDFTRIVEIKHATGQATTNTTIVREFPDDYAPGKEAYYPVPTPDSSALYKKYKEMADATPRTSFIGRLATYRYYNMDQVVGMALAEFDRLARSTLRVS